MLYFHILRFLIGCEHSIFWGRLLILFFFLMNNNKNNEKVPGEQSILNENMTMDG